MPGEMSNWGLHKFHKWVWPWPWTFNFINIDDLERPWTPKEGF